MSQNMGLMYQKYIIGTIVPFHKNKKDFGSDPVDSL
jgi:hypothetical protein